MTHVALKDELLDAQLLRAIGAAAYGGSDVGECLATARRIAPSRAQSLGRIRMISMAASGSSPITSPSWGIVPSQRT